MFVKIARQITRIMLLFLLNYKYLVINKGGIMKFNYENYYKYCEENGVSRSKFSSIKAFRKSVILANIK